VNNSKNINDLVFSAIAKVSYAVYVRFLDIYIF
jgi:hypothetical protein